MNSQFAARSVVRTHASPLRVLNRVRAEIKAVDADQQASGQVRDLEQWIQREDEDEYAYGRLVAALFSGISIVALVLAAIGLFSVVSYGVAQTEGTARAKPCHRARDGGYQPLLRPPSCLNLFSGQVGCAREKAGAPALGSRWRPEFLCGRPVRRRSGPLRAEFRALENISG